jgi:hypothetical protein
MTSDPETRPEQARSAPETGEITVDATVLSELLNVAAAEIPALMRAGAITSLCERGTGADEGRFRLSFFYRNRRARLHVDEAGCILRRGVIDFGEKRLPAELRRAGDSTPRITGASPKRG